MPTSAPTSPQLAVYVKLLCLLMVVICGAASPVEERVRLFSVKTKGFMEISRRGPLVTAKNVTFSKFNNLTIRSTKEIGVVELVFADHSPQRRLCIDSKGNLKGMKKLHPKRRQPGCLFRECVDGVNGDYLFYLTTQRRPRLMGFGASGEPFNPLGPSSCCDLTRRGGDDGEHLVPDDKHPGQYKCARRRAPHKGGDPFLYLKIREKSFSDAIPAHNHHQGGHTRDRPHADQQLLAGPRAKVGPPGGQLLSDGDEDDKVYQQPRKAHHQLHHQLHQQHDLDSANPPPQRRHRQHKDHQQQNHQQQLQLRHQGGHHHQQQQEQAQQQPRPHRHHHHLVQDLPRTHRPTVRVRSRSKANAPWELPRQNLFKDWD